MCIVYVSVSFYVIEIILEKTKKKNFIKKKKLKNQFLLINLY